MTENYYLTQKLLPLYFKNENTKNFFYNVIGCNPDNLKIFFEQEIYGWVKEDFFKSQNEQTNAQIPDEEKKWNYEPVQTFQNMSDNKKWITIFVKFPPEFVTKTLDSISIAIAMKGNPKTGLEVKLFYLELGESVSSQELCVYVCERYPQNDKHTNLGKIEFDEKFMTTFRNKIQSSLKN